MAALQGLNETSKLFDILNGLPDALATIVIESNKDPNKVIYSFNCILCFSYYIISLCSC